MMDRIIKALNWAWRQSKRVTSPFGTQPFEEMAKRDLEHRISGCMGYFDQIMVSETCKRIIRAFDIGKQEFTTSHFDTKQRTIQRLSAATERRT
jgi:LPS O-antigen subunit length determinant protein (WzzB/FepE family)